MGGPILMAALMPQSASAASAGNSAAPPAGTGRSDEPPIPAGAPSSVDASGTIRTVTMGDLAAGTDVFTKGQVRSRVAGFGNVTGLVAGVDGIGRRHRDRTFDVGGS